MLWGGKLAPVKVEDPWVKALKSGEITTFQGFEFKHFVDIHTECEGVKTTYRTDFTTEDISFEQSMRLATLKKGTKVTGWSMEAGPLPAPTLVTAPTIIMSYGDDTAPLS